MLDLHSCQCCVYNLFFSLINETCYNVDVTFNFFFIFYYMFNFNDSFIYILLQLCQSLFKTFLELYCRFPGPVRTVLLSYLSTVTPIHIVNVQHEYRSQREFVNLICQTNIRHERHTLTFLSSVPHLCIFRLKFTHHYAGSLQSDRVCCSLENSLPVNLLVLSASPESWRAEFILPSVAPSVDNLLCWEDLDRRNIR